MKYILLITIFCTCTMAYGVTPASGNGIVISTISNSSQTHSPETVTRFFKPSEIPNYAQAVINGVPQLTQCDVKDRWPDGSVKFAIISFVVPRIDPSGILISFRNQPSGNNTGYLTKVDMLAPAYNFDARLSLTGARHSTISARDVLSTANFIYWLKGPIVTAIIIEDRARRSFDLNTDGLPGNPLHTIFEAWFYPQNHTVDVGITLENTWASANAPDSARHQAFTLSISTGANAQMINLTQPAFTQFAFTRWRRDYWIGGTPVAAKVRFDFNTAYLESTGAYPNWMYTVNNDDITNERSAYHKLQASYPQRFTLPGYDAAVGGGIASYPQAIDQPGEWRYGDWKGLFTSWDALYFFSGDPELREEMLTNADLAGRFPIWFREADHDAGTGVHFDAPISGVVDPYGRVISINAREQFTASLANWQPKCGGDISDNVNTLTPLNYPSAYGGWRTLNTSHIPAFGYMAYTLTGKYEYLEEVQMQAAGELASVTGCFNLNAPYYRQGYLGFANAAGTRNTAWQFRDMAYAAYLSPDGEPERNYFRDKLLNNLALQEGGHGLPLDILDTQDRLVAYQYGKNRWRRTEALNPSPFGVWYTDTAYGQTKNCINNVKTGYLSTAYANFQEHFMIVVLGTIQQLGIADTKPLLTIFGRRYFHIILDPTVQDPYLVQEYVYPQQTANGQWVADWTTFKNAYCVPETSWAPGNAAIYAQQALGAMSYMTDITVDGYSGLEAWSWLKKHLPTKPDARWSQAPR